MNNVLSALQPKAHVGSNGFDVSHRDVFSTKPGLCLPVFYRHVPYKSTFRVDIANIIETTTLQTNAFARGSFNLDMYFVPYSQIFRHADEIILGRGQHNRRFTFPDNDPSNPLSMPTFPLADVLAFLFQEWVIDKVSPNGSKITGRKAFVDVFGNNAAEDALRLLDLLGYGNFLPVFKSVFYDLSPATSDTDNISYVTSTFNSSEFAVRAIYSQVYGREFTDEEIENFRDITVQTLMLMLTGTASWTFTTQQSQYVWSYTSKQYNIFAIASYQKIWSDMFRNFIYDTEDYTDCFNFDWLLQSNVSTDVSSSYENIETFVNRVFMPRYRQWKKDLFTGTYPSAQFGDVAFQQVSDGTLSFDSEDGRTPVHVDSDGIVVGNRAVESLDDPAKFQFNGVGISALDIRYTMAMQRYRERLLRSGNRTKDVLQAQFGVSSRYIEDDYVDFITSFSGTLNINKVAGTTNEGNTSIGELGAYGNASIQGAQFERQFDDYGIIMGILSFVPETEYDSYMVDPFNTKTEKMDYAQPDFENLGLSPVYGFELDQRLGNMVLGYTARYHEYKMAIDKVHGEFHGPWRPLLNMYTEDAEGYKRVNPIRQGVFSDYVTPRDSYYMTSNNWLARYYINPSCMDSIFLTAVGDTQDTDPFKIDMNYIVNSVQPLSVTGLPEL